MRKIELSYQKNVRDLGGLIGFNGKKVKEGRIYRGGFLGRVSQNDIETINSLHLTDIVDFRSEVEFMDRPDYRFEGVEYHNLPSLLPNEKLKDNNTYDDSNLLWFLGESTDGYGHMLRTYKEALLTEKGQGAYRDFFKVLLEDDKRVVYFHCSQGKDRAGLAAYLLEIALGVSEKDAIDDYLRSNEAMQPRIRQYKGMMRHKPYYNKEYEKALEDVFSANVDYLLSVINTIRDQYGSVLNFIKDELNVDIEKLRRYYLDEN